MSLRWSKAQICLNSLGRGTPKDHLYQILFTFLEFFLLAAMANQTFRHSYLFHKDFF